MEEPSSRPESSEKCPRIRRWSKREGEIVGCLYEVLLGWPLFLHLIFALSALWLAGYYQYNFPFAVMLAVFYVHKVDSVQKERFSVQIQSRLEERRSRAVRVTESETVMWVNFLLQEMWPSWLEKWLSKRVGECLHVNLNYYKPKALSKLVIGFLRLGSSPPVIQSVRVHRVSENGDNAVIEMDVSFVAADDMRVELIARLKRASVGLGLTGKLYGNNLRIEGKLKLGCKFIPYYPYLGQLTVAFVTVPILGLSVRPLSSSNVDVTDLPGIATWVTKAVQTAVETCLVEPYPLNLDLIKMCGAHYGVDADKDGIRFLRGGKEGKAVGFAILEILEGKNLEPKDKSGDVHSLGHSSDLLLVIMSQHVHDILPNYIRLKCTAPDGFSDPYVKITMEKTRFKSSIKKQTLHPIWHELFRIRITSWALPCVILLRVCDRDVFGKDDELVRHLPTSLCTGWCEVDLHAFRDGKRKDIWLRLHAAKSGHLHVAVTVVENTNGSSLGTSPKEDEGSSHTIDPTSPQVRTIGSEPNLTNVTTSVKDRRLTSLDSPNDIVPVNTAPASSEEELQSPPCTGEPSSPSDDHMARQPESKTRFKVKKRPFKFLKQRGSIPSSLSDTKEERPSNAVTPVTRCSGRLSPLKRGSFRAWYKRLTVDTDFVATLEMGSANDSGKESPEVGAGRFLTPGAAKQ